MPARLSCATRFVRPTASHTTPALDSRRPMQVPSTCALNPTHRLLKASLANHATFYRALPPVPPTTARLDRTLCAIRVRSRTNADTTVLIPIRPDLSAPLRPWAFSSISRPSRLPNGSTNCLTTHLPRPRGLDVHVFQYTLLTVHTASDFRNIHARRRCSASCMNQTRLTRPGLPLLVKSHSASNDKARHRPLPPSLRRLPPFHVLLGRATHVRGVQPRRANNDRLAAAKLLFASAALPRPRVALICTDALMRSALALALPLVHWRTDCASWLGLGVLPKKHMAAGGAICRGPHPPCYGCSCTIYFDVLEDALRDIHVDPAFPISGLHAGRINTHMCFKVGPSYPFHEYRH